MNENAIANILVDLDFLEEQFRNAGRTNLNPLFTELRSVRPPAPPFILALKISFQFFFLAFALFLYITTLRRRHQSCCQIRSQSISSRHFAKRRTQASKQEGSPRYWRSWHDTGGAAGTTHRARRAKGDERRRRQLAGYFLERIVEHCIVFYARAASRPAVSIDEGLPLPLLIPCAEICGLRYLLEL